MKRSIRNLALGVWAVVGTPLFFWAFVYIAYQNFYLLLLRTSSPKSVLDGTIWVVFGLCLVSGVLALFSLPFPKRWFRVSAVVLYLVAMSGVLLVGGLFAACVGGGCV